MGRIAAVCFASQLNAPKFNAPKLTQPRLAIPALLNRGFNFRFHKTRKKINEPKTYYPD
jgi:hypothetical protein